MLKRSAPVHKGRYKFIHNCYIGLHIIAQIKINQYHFNLIQSNVIQRNIDIQPLPCHDFIAHANSIRSGICIVSE